LGVCCGAAGESTHNAAKTTGEIAEIPPRYTLLLFFFEQFGVLSEAFWFISFETYEILFGHTGQVSIGILEPFSV
jgi:hypothetical protein